MRRSCAVPGTKRRICGKRRSIFICLAPAEAFCPAWGLLPRSFFKKAMGPVLGLLMSKRPMWVSLTTSAADMMQTMALHSSRLACRSAKMGWKWSSKNSMVTSRMSALAMSFLTRASLCASLAYSEAEWMENASCGTKRCKLSRAFKAALLRCVSMVRMTTLMERALAVLAVMRGQGCGAGQQIHCVNLC